MQASKGKLLLFALLVAAAAGVWKLLDGEVVAAKQDAAPPTVKSFGSPFGASPVVVPKAGPPAAASQPVTAAQPPPAFRDSAVCDYFADERASAGAGEAWKDLDATNALLRAVADKPDRLVAMLGNCEAAQYLHAVDMLRHLISEHPESALAQQALRMAASTNPVQQRHAFDVLQGHPATARIHQLAMKVVLEARDPPAVASAIGAMRAGSASEAEKQAVTQVLLRLAQYEGVEMRKQSLQALALWDADKGRVAAMAAAALADNAPAMRESALMLIVSGQVDAQGMSAPLATLLTAPEQDLKVRALAWQAMQRTPMTAQQAALHQQAYAEIAAGFKQRAAAGAGN